MNCKQDQNRISHKEHPVLSQHFYQHHEKITWPKRWAHRKKKITKTLNRFFLIVALYLMRVMFSFFLAVWELRRERKWVKKKIVDWNWRKLIGLNEMKWNDWKKQMKSNEFHRRTNWKKMGSFWHLAQLISAPSYDKGIDWKRATVVDINCFIEKWFCKDVTLGTDIERTNGRTDQK